MMIHPNLKRIIDLEKIDNDLWYRTATWKNTDEPMKMPEPAPRPTPPKPIQRSTSDPEVVWWDEYILFLVFMIFVAILIILFLK